jgi:hypothetical protein
MPISKAAKLSWRVGLDEPASRFSISRKVLRSKFNGDSGPKLTNEAAGLAKGWFGTGRSLKAVDSGSW